MDPLLILVVSALATVIISAICSLTEAALYSVPISYIRTLVDQKSAVGQTLSDLKSDIGRPIAAILILNTVSNTGGAAVAGWAAGQVLSATWAVIYSILFVLVILFFSEIFPKTLGVVYARQISLFVAWPLYFLIRLLAPIIWLSQVINRLMGSHEISQSVSEEEVRALASLGAEEGALHHFEGSVIANVLGLDQLLVRDILTPRVVVFRLDRTTTLQDVKEQIGEWNYSRVPLFDQSSPDDLKSYVTQRDLFRAIISGQDLNQTVGSFARSLETVPELLRVDKLLLRMFEHKEHLCAVVDEYGALAGIVTLEDVIEEIVGREIVDEYDTVSDLRTFARVLNFMKARKRK